MVAHEYFILALTINPKLAIVKENIPGVPRDWNMKEGVPMGADFPANAVYYTAKGHSGMKLADSLPNHINLLMVSAKLRALLLRDAAADIEFLPFRLLTPKGRLLSSEYFVANILGTVDCLDYEKSEYEVNAIEDDRISTFMRIVIDPKKVPNDAKLFRLKQRPITHIIRSDLIKILDSEKVTGMELFDIGQEILI